MTHGSLFSGIGGFDLAAEWMGWENKFHCEWNEFGQKVLKHYWPHAKSYGDITKKDFTIWRGKIDVLSGGFPCQPFSSAGKRLGKEDDRHLWPEMLRAIREIQPRWVVGENVSGLLNWNNGLVLDEIKADLEAAGFEVFPPLVLPACAVNAPHRRDRVWIIVHSNSNGQIISNGKNEINSSEGREYALNDTKPICNASDSNQKQLNATFSKDRSVKDGRLNKKEWSKGWSEFELVAGTGYSQTDFYNGVNFEPTIIRVNDGLSEELDELEAYGNSVVPQVVYQIFKAIEKVEHDIPLTDPVP